MSDSLLPAHLRNVPHIAAFEQVWIDRVESIDFSACMMYMVDTCAPKALTYLADQFGIITLRSWKLATSDDERRTLIKNAIDARASIGTVAAVKAAIASLGFDPSHLVERCGTDPVTGWAQFKMAFSDAELLILDTSAEYLLQLINDTKPARCEYVGLDYSLSAIVDTFATPTEDVEMSVSEAIVDTVSLPGFKYDGAHKYDGSMKYRSKSEDINMHIVP